VEFGGSKPLILTQNHVQIMAENLSRLCEAMCDNDYYICKREDVSFRMNTTGSYRVARMFVDKNSISLKLSELRYLLNMFYIIQNQLTLYLQAMQDVISYAKSALHSITYIEPGPLASKEILYY
jgi:regulatory protein YycI of two-component signal transduction system YycFG